MKDRILNTIEFSDKVIVSDPCYDRGIWCAAQLSNVLPGKWVPIIKYKESKDWGTRVRALVVHHETYKPNDINEWIPEEIGVDSGQCGIYCDTIYPTGSGKNKSKSDEEWYDSIYLITSKGYAELHTWYNNGKEGEKPDVPQGGTFERKSVITSSGYGDGGYPCAIRRNAKGKIVGIKIVFI